MISFQRPSSTFSASSTPEAAISGVMPGYELFCVYPTYLSVLPFWINVADIEHQSKIETLRPQAKSELRGATREDLKQRLIEEAESVSVEEVCMISFLSMEGNGALIKLLDDAFAPRAAGAPPPRHVDAVAALTFVPANEIATRTRKSS